MHHNFIIKSSFVLLGRFCFLMVVNRATLYMGFFFWLGFFFLKKYPDLMGDLCSRVVPRGKTWKPQKCDPQEEERETMCSFGGSFKYPGEWS